MWEGMVNEEKEKRTFHDRRSRMQRPTVDLEESVSIHGAVDGSIRILQVLCVVADVHGVAVRSHTDLCCSVTLWVIDVEHNLQGRTPAIKRICSSQRKEVGRKNGEHAGSGLTEPFHCPGW